MWKLKELQIKCFPPRKLRYESTGVPIVCIGLILHFDFIAVETD